MSETTSAVNTASTKTAKAAAAVAETLPTVVETAEVAMEIPTKVVLNQKLVVAVSLLTGAALGAGVLFGVNKWRNRDAAKLVDVPDTIEEVDVEKK